MQEFRWCLALWLAVLLLLISLVPLNGTSLAFVVINKLNF